MVNMDSRHQFTAGLLIVAAALTWASFMPEKRDSAIKENPVCRRQFQCPVGDDREYINGSFVNPETCTEYYHCISGIPWPQQCPPGLHFSPTIQTASCSYSMCVLPSISSCVPPTGDHTKRLTCTEDGELLPKPVPDPTLNVCPFDPMGQPIDGTVPSPTDCAIYYHCVGGVAWPQQCPPDFYFSPSIDLNDCNQVVCVPPQEASCPINGGWGGWSAWGNCSNNCGVGLQSRTRECDNPPPSNGGSECTGAEFELEFCNGTDCPPEYNGTAFLFFVGKRFDWYSDTEKADPVEFDAIDINLGNMYDVNTHTFSTSRPGRYFMSMSAGAIANRPVDMELTSLSGTRDVSIARTTNVQTNRDTSAREVIIDVQAGEEYRMVGGLGSGLGGDIGFPTSWMMIAYSEMAAVERSFSAGRSSWWISPPSLVNFDTVITNTEGDFNPSNGRFVCNQPGIYYFTYSVGVPAFAGIDARMVCLGDCYQYASIVIRRDQRNYSGTDTIFRSAMFEVGLYAEVYIQSTTNLYSDSKLQTSFSGFLYETSTTEGLAWSVARTSTWSSSSPVVPLAFDHTILQHRQTWNALGNYAECKEAGYYYVHMSAGVAARARVDMRLHRDDVYIADLTRLSTQHTATDTISRSLIVYCEQGSRLQVYVEGGTTLTSNPLDLSTSFSGFLIGSNTR